MCVCVAGCGNVGVGSVGNNKNVRNGTHMVKTGGNTHSRTLTKTHCCKMNGAEKPKPQSEFLDFAIGF